ncbi:MAG: hypothetical protein H6835_07365 [Planctomycetes bacterium]|nr:hypothetical protein [Planctomycetota bacterium]
MRLPIPFLLYVTALGLFGWAGWTVYQMLPQWSVETRNASAKRGYNDAVKLTAQGKGAGPITADWRYERDVWWPQLKQVNLVGKLPPEPVDPVEAQRIADEQKKPQVDTTPLEDIFELVSLVYDSDNDGKGPQTHVIIRYKQGANVEPPEWWVRENTPPTPGGFAGGSDRIPSNTTAQPRNTNRAMTRGRSGGQSAGSPMPTAGATSLAGREILQELWLEESAGGRRTPRLWPQYAHIRLVRVAPDAQSAFFVRDVAPPTDGSTPPEPEEEELLKTTMNLSQDVLVELRRLQGRETPRASTNASTANDNLAWKDVEETTRFGNQFHIGRKDEERFRQGADDFLGGVYLDTYTSRHSSTRGLQVRQVDSKIAQSYGVVQGDVLLEINNRKVESKAQATNQVTRDYDRGVRTFTTKWLSNGQVVERVYQAPDR